MSVHYDTQDIGLSLRPLGVVMLKVSLRPVRAESYELTEVPPILVVNLALPSTVHVVRSPDAREICRRWNPDIAHLLDHVQFAQQVLVVARFDDERKSPAVVRRRYGKGNVVASGGYVALIEAQNAGQTLHVMRRKIAVVR